MMNTITTIKLPDGQVAAFVDWSDMSTQSTCELVHGFTTQEIDLFAYTVGEPVPTASAPLTSTQRQATDADTNQEAPAAMASTEERLVYAIKPEVHALTVDPPVQDNVDMNTAIPRPATGEPMPNPVFLSTLNLRLLLTLEISQKFYQRAGFGYYNPGFGPLAGSSTTFPAAAAGRTYANQGLPSQEAVRSFVVPQYMGGQEKFRLFLSNPGGIPVLFGNSENGAVPTNEEAIARVRVYLEGLYKRPVS